MVNSRQWYEHTFDYTAVGEELYLTYNAQETTCKEYFDDYGRNIAIEDRYGNRITLEYTTVNSGRTVTQIKITDTLGNIIIYKKEPLLNVQTWKN